MGTECLRVIRSGLSMWKSILGILIQRADLKSAVGFDMQRQSGGILNSLWPTQNSILVWKGERGRSPQQRNFHRRDIPRNLYVIKSETCGGTRSWSKSKLVLQTQNHWFWPSEKGGRVNIVQFWQMKYQNFRLDGQNWMQQHFFQYVEKSECETFLQKITKAKSNFRFHGYRVWTAFFLPFSKM